MKRNIVGKLLHSMSVLCNLKMGPFFMYDNAPINEPTKGDNANTQINPYVIGCVDNYCNNAKSCNFFV